MRPQDRGLSILFLAILLIVGHAAAWAAKTPAVPVPSDRWGTLQPVGILGDSTSFTGTVDPVQGKIREYHDLDIENGWLFTATGQGMAIFDVRVNPAPTFALSYIFGWINSGNFPVWNYSDKDWYIKEVDAPAGYDGLVALGMEDQGFAIVNTVNKGAPVVAYQGALGIVTRVYAFTSGGTHYAYAVTPGNNGRIHRFNLSAAAGMNKCNETPPTLACPGVYLGEVAGFSSGNYYDLQGMPGFVATSRAGVTGGVKVWSIADPAMPVERLSIPGSNRSASLWQQGSSIYLIRLTESGQLSVHDVSCVATGPCASVPPALWTHPTGLPGLLYLKLSVDGGRPYVYVGADNLGGAICAPQREYIFDLANPAQPVELTPKNAAGPYWGWYYQECGGFNLVGPRRGRVYNGVLYRAAMNLLDAHRVQTVCEPHVDSVTVSPPNPVVCQSVTFQATGVTGTPPILYTWTLLDAGSNQVPGGSSSTGTLTWNTASTTPPGTYKATVTVSKTCSGVPKSDSKSATVTLSPLPPLPAAGSFTPTTEPATGIVTGTAVKFHANASGATAWNWDFDGDGVFNEADWTSNADPTFTYSTAGVRQVKVKVRNCVNLTGVVSAARTVDVKAAGGIVINGPTSVQANEAQPFAASGTGGCSPTPNGWDWTAAGGVINGEPNATVTISWTTTGTKTVSAKNSACPNLSASVQVKVNPPLKACFTTTPSPLEDQPVSFDGSCSIGNPDSYVWDFGDGTPVGSGKQISHTYANPGTYQATLSITRAGSDCPPAPFCENSKTQQVEVGSTLLADFNWTVSCNQPPCDPEVGRPVTFTDQSSGNPTSRSWSFGDGGTATGTQVTHVFIKAGDIPVTLTIGNGSSTASVTKIIPVVLRASPVVVPWVARSRGTLVQTSDLYITNPGTVPMGVLIEFRRRGAPEINPPRVVQTVAPGATLYAPDCVKSLFGKDENISGFVLVTPAAGSPQPVVTSHQTSGPSGSAFGLAVQGIPLSPAGGGLQLVGMNDNSKRTAFLGITNPNDAPATYRLRFFNAAGQAIGTPSADLTLSRFGQRQFQLAEIRSMFGISSQEDYRVAVESAAGPLYPYGVDVWSSTNDPSLAGNGPGEAGRAWLIGVSNKPGADGKAWKTDAILSNATGQPLAVNLIFTPLGVASTPTAPSRVSVAPGTTLRLLDVLKKQWSLTNAVGVLAIDSDPAGGALPAAFAENYRSPLLGKRYGHSMAVMREADAAGVGRVHSLAGLRQDGQSRTTIWVLNAGAETGEYDVIYRGLDGAELGRIVVRLAPGKVRQLNPTQHPLPETGVAGGFTVEIQVRAGKVLAAAQVVNSANNDSAYVRGVTP